MKDRTPLSYIDDDSQFGQSEKTVFVVDGAEYITQVSSGHSCQPDHLREPKKAGKVGQVHPIDPILKTIWTCSIEAVVEYSRIVWDLFPKSQRVISLMTSSCPKEGPVEVTKINGWNEEQQSLHYLLKSLAMDNSKSPKSARLYIIPDISGMPTSNGKDLIPVLEKAIEQIGELTNAQKQSKSTIINRGRIILISSFRDQASLDNLIERFPALFESRRQPKLLIKPESDKGIISSATMNAAIDRLELLIINTFPISDKGPTSMIKDRPLYMTSEHTTLMVRSVESGRNIAGVLSNFCLQHYRLRSTTITGIPMKEEQNASSSSNYDVELMHCSSAHDDLTASLNPLFEGVVNTKHRHGYPYESYTLRWCTPRSNNVELFHCTNTCRITTVDVNSRPSSCLTNFLLNGRAVLLEIYRSKNSRMTSHMLASHSGELYIHTLATNKLNLDDTMSIVECTGGRVTDYRTNEFINFVKKHTLKPCRSIEGDPTSCLNRALSILDRSTLYWPLVSSHTIMFNLANKLARIVEIIPKSQINQSEVLKCKKNIFDLVSMESEFAAIPQPSIGIKSPTGSKSQKIDHNYRLLWNELEHFLRIHCATSEHELVLECLMECRTDSKKSTDGKKGGTTSRKSVKSSKKGPDEPKSPPAKRAKK